MVVSSAAQHIYLGHRFAYLTARPLVLIGLQQLRDEVFRFLAHFLPVALVEDDTTVLAFLNQICEVLRPEGGVTAEQCVGDDSHRPHVDRLAMSLLHHDFWCCISEGASHGSQHLVLRVQHLRDTEVSQHKGGVSFASEVE
jgi:hypothetical protein